MRHKLLSFVPLVLIALAGLGVYFSGVLDHLSFQAVREEHLRWQEYASAHLWLSSLVFLSVYSLSVTLLIPSATLLTLLGGLLFPLPLAIFYACLAETIGGTLFFIAARLASVGLHLEKVKWLHQFEKKIVKDEVYYLLFFRLSHLLPFWLINLSAAALLVRPGIFVWTLFVGVIPFAVVFSEVGSGLSHYLATHERFELGALLNTQVKIALVAAGLCALVPLVWRKYKKH